MKYILFLLALPLFAQTAQTRWYATTGNVSQSGATYTATIQQPTKATQTQAYLDQIVVYCSAACTVTQSTMGTAATATAGSVVPLLPSGPTPIPTVNFFTASNVGTGTQQGGIVNLGAGSTATLCLSPACGNPGQIQLPTGGTASNYSVQINAITGTSNITFYGRSNQ